MIYFFRYFLVVRLSFVFSFALDFFLSFCLHSFPNNLLYCNKTHNTKLKLNFRRACQFCYSTTTTQSVESILQSEHSCRGILVRFAFVESCRVRYRALCSMCDGLSNLSCTHKHTHTERHRHARNTCDEHTYKAYIYICYNHSLTHSQSPCYFMPFFIRSIIQYSTCAHTLCSTHVHVFQNGSVLMLHW